MLILADTLNLTTPNLAKLEDLFNNRNDLLFLYFKSRFNFEVLQTKRKSEGKSIPSWSKVEFAKKDAEIKNEIKKNQSSLKLELDLFFNNLEKKPSGELLIH